MTGPCREIVAVEVVPLSDAVRVPLPSELSAPAEAVKLAVVELAGIETEGGTLKAALLDARPTIVAVVREGFDKVTVQAVLPLEARLDAVHVREDRLMGD